ncbi:MAG: transcription elongation factor GreA, partial [Planctomycetaceae bacterium]|nr:transcription elongation factor GreA [Planctomycetaceae bacterium]
MERQPITREGQEKLRAEIKHLETVVLPAITEKVADARAEGDLKENAEYHGQREQ